MEFLESGIRRLAGDTKRSATTCEVRDIKRQARELKEVMAEQAGELTSAVELATAGQLEPSARGRHAQLR
jgi:hypothetical protein